jgi:hypothetical protein
MIYIEQFIRHLRNSSGDDIAFSLWIGFTLIFSIGVAIFTVWALIEWLGVFVVLVPIVIGAALLIFYGVGRLIMKRFDL